MASNPWFKFYPSNWRGSARLRDCSPGARALLIEMMCIMHDAEPYGHLVIAGRPLLRDADIAMHVTMKTADVTRWRAELEGKDLIERNDKRVIYNAKMVRDEGIRRRRAAGGKLSATHPNTPDAKGTHDGPPLLRQKGTHQGTHDGPTQITEYRDTEEKRVREHPKSNASPTSISAIVGQILPSASK